MKIDIELVVLTSILYFGGALFIFAIKRARRIDDHRIKELLRVTLTGCLAVTLVFVALTGLLLSRYGVTFLKSNTEAIKEAIDYTLWRTYRDKPFTDSLQSSIYQYWEQSVVRNALLDRSRLIDITLSYDTGSNCLKGTQFVEMETYNPGPSPLPLHYPIAVTSFLPPCDELKLDSSVILDSKTGDTIARSSMAVTRGSNSGRGGTPRSDSVLIRPGGSVISRNWFEARLSNPGELSYMSSRPAADVKALVLAPKGLKIAVDFYHPNLSACKVDSAVDGIIRISIDAPVLPGNGFRIYWR